MVQMAAAALLLCNSAHAAPPSQKSRTLQELIKLTLLVGADDAIAADNAKLLGLGTADRRTKNMWVEEKDAPDGRQHVLDVVLGAGGVECVTLSQKKTNETDDGIYLDGFWFRLTLRGELMSAMSFEGRSGELYRKRLSPDDAKTLALFKRERDFWLKESGGLYVQHQ